MQQFKTVIDNTPRLLLRTGQCLNAGDPKLGNAVPPVYVPLEDYAHALKTLSNVTQVKMFDADRDMKWFYGAEAMHGLLYLPFPYLVPGGRFNEMYGWDTAFPVFAWKDDHPQIMREQVDNQLYQIRMYGKVLNANRTYYLSRSQPPFIAAMALCVWQAAEGRDWADFDPDGLYADANVWLRQAYDLIVQYHTYWTSGDRLADGGPLSRYWDDGDTPAPEVTSSEAGHFDHARNYFIQGAMGAEEDHEDITLFYDQRAGLLTPLYHRANRAMRASGFDPTAHWGYGALHCMFHAPLCLNALLYKMEGELAEMAEILSLGSEIQAWKGRRDARRTAMRELLYDRKTGMYHDYDFVRKKLNTRPFATFFLALWSGLYDDDKKTAHKAAAALLEKLETPYGLSMSTEISGSQWDHPYGWPPMQYIAFMGLHHVGLTDDARRIARKYYDLAMRVFADRGALYEKYNMVEGNADIHVVNGYHENATESGTFLWTAATLKMAQDFIEEQKPETRMGFGGLFKRRRA